MAPLGAVNRLSTDYVLRVVDTIMSHLGDPLEGLILLALLHGNTEHLSSDVRGGAGTGAEDFVSDAMRRPVRVAEIARRLRLPAETVRRHAGGLLERELCARTPDGLMIPAATLARPAIIALMGENLINLQRMFASLAQLGVLRAWDDLRPTAESTLS
ncbi:MAG: ArsR family transcriptional regulator [Alphaproteobacteria bacterium]|nr:ArsR family transcriptional regulator [Alphaproteobacteria bacterium]